MGVGLRRFPHCRGSWLTAPTVRRPAARSKFWPCARLPTGLSTVSQSPSLAIFLSRRHEPVEVGACETRAGRLESIGWRIKRQGRGSHRVLEREGWPNYVFAFHENEEIGPKMLSRIARHTGLTPED